MQQSSSLTAGTALAADPPVGDWLVKDGYANIRIDNCAGKIVGHRRLGEGTRRIDKENPDPAKKDA